MPFLDHLEELRWRILYSLLAIVVATLVGWVIVERVDVVGLLIRPIAPLLPGGKLKFTSPTEPFFITLKFAFALASNKGLRVDIHCDETDDDHARFVEVMVAWPP